MEEQQKDIIFGRHPVIDAVKAGHAVDKIIIQQGIRGEFEKEIRQLCKTADIPLLTVPKERMGKWTRGNHQGIIALISAISFFRLEQVLPNVFERGEVPLFLILDGITDVRNFGAIARTAEVCGAHGLVVPQKKTAWINAEAMKASAGALGVLPVCREPSLVNALGLLRNSGVQVLASDLYAEKYLFDMDLQLPTAIILGAEGGGIGPATRQAADDAFIIPQKGQTDSLNVSVAAGMILYEAVRQRWA